MVAKKCDVMGQNQSHVAKRKRAEICILSENVKLCQTKYLCKFLSRKLMFPPFCYFFHVFFGFYGRIFKDDETQLFFFKVSFLIILDF